VCAQQGGSLFKRGLENRNTPHQDDHLYAIFGHSQTLAFDIP